MIPANLRTTLRSLVSGESAWPLFIYGQAGVGKTCAALCLLDYAGGEYFTVGGLCAKLIDAQQGRLTTGEAGCVCFPDDLWALIARSPLVVLDELGCRDKVSDAHYDAVKTCIDERQRRPFVAISNHALEEIADLYDGRVFSRLAAGTIFQLVGEDQRNQ